MEENLKQLLLKDLCARLPYRVKIEGYELPCIILDSDWLHFMYTHKEFAIRRPYLRPMSSMTEKEKKELNDVTLINYNEFEGCSTLFDEEGFDWLNAHHFDYRGLIEKGLAIKAPEGMYEY